VKPAKRETKNSICQKELALLFGWNSKIPVVFLGAAEGCMVVVDIGLVF
jgi:hypothetical protein